MSVFRSVDVAPARVSILRVLLGAVMAVALAFGTLSALAPKAHANPSDGFQAGNIISDYNFYGGTQMTAAEIQAFLNARVPRCTIGDPGRAGGSWDGRNQIAWGCLKDAIWQLGSRPANQYCNALPGGSNLSSAEVIARVGVACGINPKVLLIMLEKEQSLITDSWPYVRQFNFAMGYDCPDSGPNNSANCNSGAGGFTSQVYRAAWQLKVYRGQPQNFNYRPYQNNTILWHPNRACGTSTVYIENNATAALYIYTPYRPNAAALAAGWGTGDACSTYGNRNFYNFYKAWFGNPTQSGPTAAELAAAEKARLEAERAAKEAAEKAAAEQAAAEAARKAAEEKRKAEEEAAKKAAEEKAAAEKAAAEAAKKAEEEKRKAEEEAAKKAAEEKAAQEAAKKAAEEKAAAEKAAQQAALEAEQRAAAEKAAAEQKAAEEKAAAEKAAQQNQQGSQQAASGSGQQQSSSAQGGNTATSAPAEPFAGYNKLGGAQSLGTPVGAPRLVGGLHVQEMSKGVTVVWGSGKEAQPVPAELLELLYSEPEGSIGAPAEAATALGQGTRQKFEKAELYTSTKYGAYSVSGQILSALNLNGGAERLGLPVGPQYRLPNGTIRQDFEQRSIEWNSQSGARVYIRRVFFN